MSTRGHQTGLSAELSVTLHYRDRGAELLAERMRNAGGEIDLIFRQGDEIVFVEVKARRDRDRAAGALGAAQAGRIRLAAEIWLDEEGLGGLHPARIDLALVDRQGAIEIVENAVEG